MSIPAVEMDFLRSLSETPKSRKDLPPVTTREEDRARQVVRKRGWAKYEDGAGWRLTKAGQSVLDHPETNP